MGNHVSSEQSGTIPLQAFITKKMLQDIFADAEGYGDWWLTELNGALACEYYFRSEGNYRVRDLGFDEMLDRLVSAGYNRTAWRETVMTDSENGGMNHDEHLRGTEEQQRQFRLQEIEDAIAALEAERVELLGGCDNLVAELELSVRATNALLSDGLLTITDIRQLGSEEALLRVPNFGRKALNELKEVLQQQGQRLF